MPQQSQNLIMVSLGVVGDTLPDLPPVDPPLKLEPLKDGIHLRWLYILGFPWYGFYLFRRRSLEPREYQDIQVPSDQHGQNRTRLPGDPYGDFSSDVDLNPTDFPDGFGNHYWSIDLSTRSYVRYTLPTGLRAWRVRVELGIRTDDYTEISVRGYLDDVPVGAPVSVSGRGMREQTIWSELVEFDQMSAIEISCSRGSAVLITVRLALLSSDAKIGWEKIPDFSYPLSLPLTQADYPCTPRQQEDLEQARQRARQRIIQSNDADQFTPQPNPWYTSGSVSVTKGSPLVKGDGTKWDPEVVGLSLQVGSDTTAYTIVMFVDPGKLVLSRDYGGSSKSRESYTISEDPFGQLHDSLVHLVSGGIVGGDMRSRSLPVPIPTTGTINYSFAKLNRTR
jgi:hypothetical protein